MYCTLAYHQKEAAKVATLVKFFNVEKAQACDAHQDFEIPLFPTLFNTNGYVRASLGKLAIMTSKD